MRKALLVARWEFLATVTRVGYIVTVVAMPLFYGGMIAVAGVAGRSATTTAGRVPTGVVDEAHILDLPFAAAQAARREGDLQGIDLTAIGGRQPAAASAGAAIAALTPPSPLVLYESVDEAIAAMRTQTVAAVFAIGADYLTTGRITAYGRDSGIFGQQADQRRQGQVADAIRASLMRRSMADDALARAYAPAARVTRMRVTSQGRVEPLSDPLGLGPFAGSFGVTLLLTMSIFFSAGFLQQATLADRQNRMIEILLSSLDSNELLAGKLLGLGAAGLLQVSIYVALIIVPGTALLSIFQVPLERLLLLFVYYGIGYTLFAAMMTGTGMLGRTPQEAAQLSALWTIASAAPFFFVANIGTNPSGLFARSLSFFPLTSPVTMLLRLGNGDVPPLDLAISIAIDLAAIVFVLRAASRIFRAASLMHGQRATLPEFIRWLRAS